jgi:EmrB/QacA subfamily drug resistance transporter
VLGSALAFIDATVVIVALPRIGADLGVRAGDLQWVVNGNALSLSALTLLGGALGDRFGRRRVFVLGVCGFAVGSLLCGLAPTIRALVAARIAQGVGGALLTPGALAILETSFRREDRAKAIGAWSGLGGVAGAIGPFVGGWLVQAASWRLVFLVNLPIAAVVVAVALRHVPESRSPEQAGLDAAGAIAAATSLAGLTYGFTAWPSLGPSLPVVAALAVGVAGLGALVLAEARAESPMLPLSIFRSRTFTAANAVTFTVYAALGGVFFLLALQLQVVAGFRPLTAGTALLPITALMLLLSSRGGALAERIGARIPMTLGPLVCAGGLLLLARLGPGASYARAVLPGAVLLGVGLSLTVAPLTASALGALGERHAGIASGVNNAVARAASLLAVAILPLAAGLRGGSLVDPAVLPPVFRAAMGFSASLLVAAAAIAFVWMPPRAPAAARARAAGVRRHPVRVHCAVAGPPLLPRRSITEPFGPDDPRPSA